MARKRKTDGRAGAGSKRNLEPPGGVLGSGQIQLGIEDDELPADQGEMGIRAGVSAQAAELARDSRADDCPAGEDRDSRPGEGGRGQSQDSGDGQPVCSACQKRAGKPGGEYRMSCLDCCAVLVLSTRPNRQAAAAMLEVITRGHWQTRQDVLDRVKKIMEEAK